MSDARTRTERLLHGFDPDHPGHRAALDVIEQGSGRVSRVARTTDGTLVAEGPQFEGRHYVLLVDRKDRTVYRVQGSRVDLAAAVAYAEHADRDRTWEVFRGLGEVEAVSKIATEMFHPEAISFFGPCHLRYDDATEVVTVHPAGLYDVTLDQRDVTAATFRAFAERMYRADPDGWVEGRPARDRTFEDLIAPEAEDVVAAARRGLYDREAFDRSVRTVAESFGISSETASRAITALVTEDDGIAKLIRTLWTISKVLTEHDIDEATDDELVERILTCAAGKGGREALQSCLTDRMSLPPEKAEKLASDLLDALGLNSEGTMMGELARLRSEDVSDDGGEELVGTTVKFLADTGELVSGKVVGESGSTLYVKTADEIVEISTSQIVSGDTETDDEEMQDEPGVPFDGGEPLGEGIPLEEEEPFIDAPEGFSPDVIAKVQALPGLEPLLNDAGKELVTTLKSLEPEPEFPEAFGDEDALPFEDEEEDFPFGDEDEEEDDEDEGLDYGAFADAEEDDEDEEENTFPTDSMTLAPEDEEDEEDLYDPKYFDPEMDATPKKKRKKKKDDDENPFESFDRTLRQAEAYLSSEAYTHYYDPDRGITGPDPVAAAVPFDGQAYRCDWCNTPLRPGMQVWYHTSPSTGTVTRMHCNACQQKWDDHIASTMDGDTYEEATVRARKRIRDLNLMDSFTWRGDEWFVYDSRQDENGDYTIILAENQTTGEKKTFYPTNPDTQWTESFQPGDRVIYTDRSGKEWQGTVSGVHPGGFGTGEDRVTVDIVQNPFGISVSAVVSPDQLRKEARRHEDLTTGNIAQREVALGQDYEDEDDEETEPIRPPAVTGKVDEAKKKTVYRVSERGPAWSDMHMGTWQKQFDSREEAEAWIAAQKAAGRGQNGYSVYKASV